MSEDAAVFECLPPVGGQAPAVESGPEVPVELVAVESEEVAVESNPEVAVDVW